MTPLIALWLFALIILVGIVVYGFHTKGSTNVSSEDAPTNWCNFLAIELTRMAGYISHLLIHARPHGEKAVAHGTIFLKKGHDMFIEKIFGRIEVEKGKAASFFLKRIAEHKETLRGKGGKI